MVEGLRDLLLKLCEKLNEKRVDYLLIGGMAVMLHGLPRFTEDIDIMVDPGAENVRRLKEALHELFEDEAVDEISSSDLLKYAVVRYGTPEGFSIDLMAKVGEVATFGDMLRHRQWTTVEGVRIPLCDLRGLLKLKEGTLREKDRMDTRFLRKKLKGEVR
ncbi:MAG: hypothetical protein DRG55_06720 [Deltaproteobacteria bacterium]|nr:MAG: hypothetical protein DRG69_05475 [Deltaproteobacteria bacterium]RLB00246.1 MAG: hypothetical protein DRG55_06720 [Deltaproteobacteria bacterium]